MSNIPDGLQYSKEHEWVAGDPSEGHIVTVGITEHAAAALGDIVYVEAPEEGDEITAGEVCGELESTKAVSELYSPVSGTVTAVNQSVLDKPELLNGDAYGDGWIFKVEVSADADDLLSAMEYSDLTE